MARWTASFCSGDGRQAGLLYLAAGYRDTTRRRWKRPFDLPILQDIEIVIKPKASQEQAARIIVKAA